MRLCGAIKRNGKPCGYRLADEAECPHHGSDPSRAKAFQLKGAIASQATRIPENIEPGDLETVEDLFRLYAQVARSAAKDKNPDLKRLDVIIRAANGANAVQQTQGIKALNDTMLRMEGHGPALIFLEKAKTGLSRPLPGLKALAIKEPSA